VAHLGIARPYDDAAVPVEFLPLFRVKIVSSGLPICLELRLSTFHGCLARLRFANWLRLRFSDTTTGRLEVGYLLVGESLSGDCSFGQEKRVLTVARRPTDFEDCWKHLGQLQNAIPNGDFLVAQTEKVQIHLKETRDLKIIEWSVLVLGLLGQVGKIIAPVVLQMADVLESKLHVVDGQEMQRALLFGQLVGAAEEALQFALCSAVARGAGHEMLVELIRR